MKHPLGQIGNKTLANEVHQVMMINNDNYSYSFKWCFSVQSMPAKKLVREQQVCPRSPSTVNKQLSQTLRCKTI